jgi:hypothetical protein
LVLPSTLVKPAVLASKFVVRAVAVAVAVEIVPAAFEQTFQVFDDCSM